MKKSITIAKIATKKQCGKNPRAQKVRKELASAWWTKHDVKNEVKRKLHPLKSSVNKILKVFFFISLSFAARCFFKFLKYSVCDANGVYRRTFLRPLIVNYERYLTSPKSNKDSLAQKNATNFFVFFYPSGQYYDFVFVYVVRVAHDLHIKFEIKK